MIEEKIRQWCAAATVEEAGERVVVVPDRDVAEVCRRLHDDAEEPMDFMRDLVAADGDGRLSVFYQLESTRTGGRVTLRTDTDGREDPFLPSVCRIWKTAEIKEREAYDFFGIRFTGPSNGARTWCSARMTSLSISARSILPHMAYCVCVRRWTARWSRR